MTVNVQSSFDSNANAFGTIVSSASLTPFTCFGVNLGPHDHAMLRWLLYCLLLLSWSSSSIVLESRRLGSLLFCVSIHSLTALSQIHGFKDQLLLFHVLSPLGVGTRDSYHPMQDSASCFTTSIKPLFSKEQMILYLIVQVQSQVLWFITSHHTPRPS